MSHLMLGALGSLQVIAGNAPITSFESDKVRALLVYLAVESHQPHRREALLGLLWPDSPEEVARRNLRQALYNLRQAIGDHTADPPYLLITREEIQFNPAGDYALDVSTFTTLLDTCEEHLPRCVEVCSVHASRLEQALALYRGPFLHEFFLEDSAEFEEWAVQRREQLQRRVLEALTYLSNYYELNQEYEGARRCGLRQLEIDPWREEAHRQVMRVLWAKGDRSGALAQFEICRRVLAKDLGIEPSAATVKLSEQIKHGEPAAGNSKRPAVTARTPLDLPIQATPFVGREGEMKELSRLLTDPECRLLTLTGPGGIGKTRLALQAAADTKHKLQDGAAFVALAGLDSPDFIAPTIANAIGLVFSGPLDPKIQLLNYLRNKELLLLLDNAEHLLDGVWLFREMLEQAPRLKLLVTSREQLNLSGEWLFEVEGLELPGDEEDEGLEQSSAVALFLLRARRARQGLSLDRDEKQAVARISRLVGGMPLALELAAAWVRTLSPAEIAQEIEGGIDFLTANVRDLPERHRSMRAVFDHSWQLLSADEQAVLARLSVFRGGFQREAAEVIAGASLPLLSGLLAKSLLHRVPEGQTAVAHSVRYELHELVRQYAADRLHENPAEEAAARSRHSNYYVDWAARLEPHLKGPRQLDALAEMTAEMENIRLGWRHAVAHCQIESVRKPIRAFWSLFEMRGWYQEGQTLFGWAADELQQACGSPAQPVTSRQVALAQIQSKQGWFSVRLGQRDQARRLLEPSTATLRSLGARVELVHALHHLGVLNWQAGDSERARAEFMEELVLATQLGDRWEMALACGNLGIAAQTLGDEREALERFQTGLAAYRSLGDERMVGVALYYLGQLECELGMYPAAQDSLRESIARSRAVGEPWLLGMALTALGDVIVRSKGDGREAVALYRESLAHFERVGERWSMIETLAQLGSASLTLDNDAEALEAFWGALKLAREMQLLPGMLKALVGIAQWQLRQGQLESALLTLSKVLEAPTLGKTLQDRAELLRKEGEPQLTPEQVEMVRARARALSLDMLLAELQSSAEERVTSRPLTAP